MARETYKKERKLHEELLDMLKKHFMDDEGEIVDEELEDMKEMPKFQGLKKGKKLGDMSEEEDSDMDYESGESAYGKKGEDDEYFEDLTEDEDEDEEDEMNLPKEKRKNLAILVISKKAGKKRK